MDQLFENSGMIETALNMIVANPEMLRTIVGAFDPNNAIRKYIDRSSPDDLKKLVNRLKLLIPVTKYGYKGFKFVKKYKNIFYILIIAFIVKVFIL